LLYVNYTKYCPYTVDPPDVEQQGCPKHVQAFYWNELIENSASCWFMLNGYSFITGTRKICCNKK